MARGYTIHTRPNGDVEVTTQECPCDNPSGPGHLGTHGEHNRGIATNVIFGVFIALAIVVWIAKKVEEIKRQ